MTWNFMKFIKDDNAWADFFITRIGLILFAALLLISAFRIYPMFQEREARAGLDVIASDLASKIEAVDSMTLPGYRYSYVFDKKIKDVNIELSTEFVTVRRNFSAGIWGESELVHVEPLVTHVYPPNNNWTNISGLRKYLIYTFGYGGDGSAPLELKDKKKVDGMFSKTIPELARTPFQPDPERPLNIEKVMIYYYEGKETITRDYVLIYQ
jgi:hypothetical protein